jgi:hypothetical protein
LVRRTKHVCGVGISPRALDCNQPDSRSSHAVSRGRTSHTPSPPGTLSVHVALPDSRGRNHGGRGGSSETPTWVLAISVGRPNNPLPSGGQIGGRVHRVRRRAAEPRPLGAPYSCGEISSWPTVGASYRPSGCLRSSVLPPKPARAGQVPGLPLSVVRRQPAVRRVCVSERG